jgi:hypothetical protein
MYTVHAQDSGAGGEKTTQVTQQSAKKDTAQTDTTKHKKKSIGEEVKNDLKKNVASSSKDLKIQTTNKLEKLGLKAGAQDTSVTDTVKSNHKVVPALTTTLQKNVKDSFGERLNKIDGDPKQTSVADTASLNKIIKKERADQAALKKGVAPSGNNPLKSNVEKQANEIKAVAQQFDTASYNIVNKKNITKQIQKESDQVKKNTAGQVKATQQNVKSNAKKIAETESQLRDSKKVKQEVKGQAKEVAKQSVSMGSLNEVKQTGQKTKGEVAGVKQNAANEAKALKKKNTPDSASLKKASKNYTGKLKDDALNMQYSSDKPDDAPWKKNSLGKDADPKSLANPAANLTDLEKKPSLEDNAKNLNAPSLSDKAATNSVETVKARLKKNKLTNLQDSLSTVAHKFDADHLQQNLLGTKKVYSEKYIQKLYDSLGLAKAGKILNSASSYTKTEVPKAEMLKQINNAIAGTGLKGTGVDPSKEKMSSPATPDLSSFGNLAGLQNGDLTKFKLPPSELEGLPALGGAQLNSKYMHVVDSMKIAALKMNKFKLNEKQVGEKVKRSALKKKPSVFDKSYFECIVSFYKDSTLTISPSLGYHFTKRFSLGLGPNLIFKAHQNKINLQAGVRAFVKAEIWKQRAYLQVEDNIKQGEINNEVLKQNKIIHGFLGGGGVLLPISNSLAINMAIFYRLNKDETNPNQSPWVFRIGLSSIKKKP